MREHLAISQWRYPIFQLSLSRSGFQSQGRFTGKGFSDKTANFGRRDHIVWSHKHPSAQFIQHSTMESELWGKSRVQCGWCERMSLSGLALAHHWLACSLTALTALEAINGFFFLPAWDVLLSASMSDVMRCSRI